MDAIEFEKFIEVYETDIFSFCRYLAQDSHIAADLYQDTVLAAFEKRDKIVLTNNPKALFLSIAIGKWRNIRRKAGRRQAIAPETSLSDIQSEPATPSEASPEALALSQLEKATIREALAKMDDKFRIPLILHYYDHMDIKSIGEIINKPPGTVKSRLHKGRAILKKALE